MDDKVMVSKKVLSASVGNNEARVIDVESVFERGMKKARSVWSS